LFSIIFIFKTALIFLVINQSYKHIMQQLPLWTTLLLQTISNISKHNITKQQDQFHL